METGRVHMTSRLTCTLSSVATGKFIDPPECWQQRHGSSWFLHASCYSFPLQAVPFVSRFYKTVVRSLQQGSCNVYRSATSHALRNRLLRRSLELSDCASLKAKSLSPLLGVKMDNFKLSNVQRARQPSASNEGAVAARNYSGKRNVQLRWLFYIFTYCQTPVIPS